MYLPGASARQPVMSMFFHAMREPARVEFFILREVYFFGQGAFA